MLIERYTTCTGRIGRPEYIFCFLIPEFILLALSEVIVEITDSYFIVIIFGIITFIPSIFGTIKRIHDIGLTGWFFLLGFIPVVGQFMWILWTIIPSYTGSSQYGFTNKYDFPSFHPNKI